jgi:hypothetical protein
MSKEMAVARVADVARRMAGRTLIVAVDELIYLIYFIVGILFMVLVVDVLDTRLELEVANLASDD